MPTQPRPSLPRSGNPSIGHDGPWIALVYAGTVQQTFAPGRQEEGYRALAEAALPVEAYHVPEDQAPPPAPGAKVDPQASGWIRFEPTIDGGTAATR